MRRPSGIALLSLAAGSWALATVTSKVTLEQLAPIDLLAVEVSVGMPGPLRDDLSLVPVVGAAAIVLATFGVDRDDRPEDDPYAAG